MEVYSLFFFTFGRTRCTRFSVPILTVHVQVLMAVRSRASCCAHKALGWRWAVVLHSNGEYIYINLKIQVTFCSLHQTGWLPTGGEAKRVQLCFIWWWCIARLLLYAEFGVEFNKPCPLSTAIFVFSVWYSYCPLGCFRKIAEASLPNWLLVSVSLWSFTAFP